MPYLIKCAPENVRVVIQRSPLRAMADDRRTWREMRQAEGNPEGSDRGSRVEGQARGAHDLGPATVTRSRSATAQALTCTNATPAGTARLGNSEFVAHADWPSSNSEFGCST